MNADLILQLKTAEQQYITQIGQQQDQIMSLKLSDDQMKN